MRATGVIVFLCLLGLTGSGCDKGNKSDPSEARFAATKAKETKDGTGSSNHPTAVTPPVGEHAAKGTFKEKKSGEKKGGYGPDEGKASEKPEVAALLKTDAPPPAVADPLVGRDPSTTKKMKKQELPSGILTAGSFDDNVDPLVFNRFVKSMSQRTGLGDLPVKMQGQRVMVIVKDGADKVVGNARVKLSAGKSESVELVTRSDGRAVFMLSYDQLPSDQPLTATVNGPTGGAAVTETIPPGLSRWVVTLPGARSQLPRQLDLAIVLDTTGSMSQELNHLKAEIRGISAAVARRFPEVRQRFALVCYRDEGQGDDYVTRTFDFSDSLDLFHKRLSAQSASGGGDIPEAVHRGLEDAVQLGWKTDADTVRMAFLVGDAPPHAQHMNRTLAAANGLRKKGIALHTVACGSYDDNCEFVMRSASLLTGSRFLFLTDDSGVGGSHAEPRIPYYQVERLEKLMVRMISSELSGQQIPADPADVIRTVGRKVN